MKRRRVYVVETWLRPQRRWYVWTARAGRAQAWDEARAARAKYPGERFRTVPYESSRP
jgi:hypothetical protein